METIEFIRASLDLKIIAQRIENSLEEIKEKSPNRKEYIEPMTASVQTINKVLIFLEQIEGELITSRQRNIDLERLLVMANQECKELKQSINNNATL